MPWQDSQIQEAAAELPVGFPAPLGGGRRAPQGQHDVQSGGEGAPTPNVSAAPAVLSGINPTASVHPLKPPSEAGQELCPASAVLSDISPTASVHFRTPPSKGGQTC